ncbi:MAG: methionine biosynthesis protein MetW [Fibrobacteres bacterium]|nr:methionine biosynthesis protein MetW [Fibrobacterota bacterium]
MSNILNIPVSYRIISSIVPKGASVLDLGCGSGELLQILNKQGSRGRGVEKDENSVIECIKKGLSVFQGNIEEGLKEYPDLSYDYVILNETLQSVYNTELLLKEVLRVGKKAVVGIPNFGHWRIRLFLGLTGRLPVTKAYGYEWYNTPNIRLTTMKDFREICRKMDIKIVSEFPIAGRKELGILKSFQANLFAEHALFVIEKK